MSEILCPCCGSARINESFLGTYLARPCKHCISCGALWQEENRQPPAITPEMVYKWFCERVMAADTDIDNMFIDDKKGLCYIDEHWLPSGKPQTFIFLDAVIIRLFGWLDMPPVARGEVENGNVR